MSQACAIPDNDITEKPKTRRSYISVNPTVLTDIYEESCNMVVWQRNLSDAFLTELTLYVHQGTQLNIAKQVSPATIENDIKSLASDTSFAPQLHAYITELVDMFCCLFEAQTVGLRISTLNKAMCPRFHVDKVPCRLVTTFLGIGSQWLEHDSVNRNKLGHKSGSRTDENSGLYCCKNDIQTLATGDVAILKGELWQNNEHAGLVHRSPLVPTGETRIVMTLDLVD